MIKNNKIPKYCLKTLNTLKVLKFCGYLILQFSRFLTIFGKFCTHKKLQNHKVAKLNTCEIKYITVESEILFFLRFDQGMIFIAHIIAYLNL